MRPLIVPLGLAEQLGQLLLAQPQGFRLQHHVDAGRAIFALVDQELLGFGYIPILSISLPYVGYVNLSIV